MSDKSALARRLAERLRSEYAVEEAFWNKHRRGSGKIAINLLAEAADAIDSLLAMAEERNELLAALKDLLHELDTDDIGGLVEGRMERARTLIAKVEPSNG